MTTDADPVSGSEGAGRGARRPDSKLGRLLETETRLEASIAETRERAEALVEEARVEARRRRDRVEARLDGEAAALRREVEAGTEREIAAIRADAARRARAYRGVGKATVDALAAFVIERLVSSDGSHA